MFCASFCIGQISHLQHKGEGRICDATDLPMIHMVTGVIHWAQQHLEYLFISGMSPRPVVHAVIGIAHFIMWPACVISLLLLLSAIQYKEILSMWLVDK